MKTYKEEHPLTKEQVSEILRAIQKDVVLGAANLKSVTIKVTSGTTGVVEVRYLQ